MLKTLVAATVISLAAATASFAAPVASPASAALAAFDAKIAQSNVIEVRDDRRRSSSRHRSRTRYVPGRRYSTAPRGWRRYSARPHNWQTVGCVLVGPVWFCP